jgi:3-oxoacyl-[acyl-carrier protein] reductase
MSKKIVLIIGASSSIGCELIRQIADENTIILAHYNSKETKLLSLQEELKANIIPIQADLSIEQGVDSLVESIESSFNFPNKIVFLAAPGLSLTLFKDLQWEDFRSQMDMQLYTAYKILNRFLPEMSKEKYGKIVFMLSSYTIGIPPIAMAHYVTAKYALLGLMKSLAIEFAGKQICINAVSPSMIETGFLSQIPKLIIESTADKHPLKRNGFPNDVAPVIRFLLSDESQYMTGVNVPITGGS